MGANQRHGPALLDSKCLTCGHRCRDHADYAFACDLCSTEPCLSFRVPPEIKHKRWYVTTTTSILQYSRRANASPEEEWTRFYGAYYGDDDDDDDSGTR